MTASWADNATRPVFHFDLKRKITGLSSFTLKLQLHQKSKELGQIFATHSCVYTFVFITLLLVEVKQEKWSLNNTSGQIPGIKQQAISQLSTELSRCSEHSGRLRFLHQRIEQRRILHWNVIQYKYWHWPSLQEWILVLDLVKLGWGLYPHSTEAEMKTKAKFME